jgi:hemerythrin superfamily protein
MPKTNAITLLKKDHSAVRKLLRELQSATHGQRRTELLQDIEKELQIHTKVEEEIFYPAFKEAALASKSQKLFWEAQEEHHVVDHVLEEIKQVDPESDEFAGKAKVLKDLVESHAEEEEDQMMPQARKVMDLRQLQELGERLQARKEELQENWSERAPPMGTAVPQPGATAAEPASH